MPFLFFFFHGGGSMSNRAKFLAGRLAQPSANQKNKKRELQFLTMIGVVIAAVGLGGITGVAILYYENLQYIQKQRTQQEPIRESLNIVRDKSEVIALVTEQAEQNSEAVAQNIDPQFGPDFDAHNETYQGMTLYLSDSYSSVPDCWSIATAMFACGIFGLLQISKVQQSLRFIRRRIAFQLGFTSRGGSGAFRNRRKGQISYLTKHFFDQQLVRVALCLAMITPIAAAFCLSQPAQPMQSAAPEPLQASTNWLNWRINQYKYSNFVADWQASPYGDASAAAHVARVNWPGVFLHVATVLWAILTEWRLVVPMVLMLLFFRSARQAKVTGRRSNLKQNLRELSQYFLPVAQRSVPAVSRLVSGKQSLRQVAAPVLQISGKQQRFAQWKIKLKQRALH
jgi:hypothetical protein